MIDPQVIVDVLKENILTGRVKNEEYMTWDYYFGGKLVARHRIGPSKEEMSKIDRKIWGEILQRCFT